MRIALVTPYSWTYEGGVNRHTQALAEHLIGRGNEVRVLSPWDPPDRLSRTLHRGAAPRVNQRNAHFSSMETRMRSAVRSTPSLLSMMEQVLATVL